MDLRRMRYLIRRIPQAAFKVEKEYAKAQKMTTQFSDMPHGSGGVHSQVEDGAIRAAAAKEAYVELIEELERMRKQLKPMIDRLEKPDEKAAMRMRYLNGYSVHDIAEYIHRCERQVKRYLYPAERKITEMDQ